MTEHPDNMHANNFPAGMPPMSDEDFPEGARLTHKTVVNFERARAERGASAKEHAIKKLGWPESLDLELLAAREPQPPKFIMPDWFPCGYATLISGHGGMGKSQIVLYFMVCMALGIHFFGMSVERRKIIYLSCEDREDLLHWRLKHICAHLGRDMAELKGWLEIIDLVGHDAVLWGRDPQTGLSLTVAYGILQERVAQYETEVIAVDGITDTYDGMGGSSADIKRFVNALVALIPGDRGAVLLIGHIDKVSAKNAASGGRNTEGYSGAAGWHNSVRARWYLYSETEKDDEGGAVSATGSLCLELQKSNLGRTDQKMAFKWDNEARLFVGQQTIASAFDRRHQDLEEQAGILRAIKGCADSAPAILIPVAMQGSSTAYHVLSLRPEFPATLKSKVAKPRFRRHIEQLRQLHAIKNQQYRRTNRHLGEELALTTEGLRQCV